MRNQITGTIDAKDEVGLPTAQETMALFNNVQTVKRYEAAKALIKESKTFNNKRITLNPSALEIIDSFFAYLKGYLLKQQKKKKSIRGL